MQSIRQPSATAEVLYSELEQRFLIERTSPRAALALEQLKQGIPLQVALSNANKAETAAREMWRDRALKPFCEKHGLTEAQAISVAFKDFVFDSQRPGERQVSKSDLFWKGQGEVFARYLERRTRKALGYEVEPVLQEGEVVRRCEPGETPEFFGLYRRVGSIGDAVAEHVEDFDDVRDAIAVARFLCKREGVDLLRVPETVDPNPEPVRCVIGLEGGLFTGATATAPLEILVYDYTVEGAEDGEVYSAPGLDGNVAKVLDPVREHAAHNKQIANACFEFFGGTESIASARAPCSFEP